MIRTFRCDTCRANHIESEWEFPQTLSFCPACGSAGTEVVEWICTACSEEGVKFRAPTDPAPPCPGCAKPAYRVVYQFSVAKNSKGYAAVDNVVAEQMDNAKKPSAPAMDPRLMPRWGSVNAAMGNIPQADHLSTARAAPDVRARTKFIGGVRAPEGMFVNGKIVKGA